MWYDFDSFSNDTPRRLLTGEIIEAAIVSDVIRGPELRVLQYKTFTNDRLIKSTVQFYTPLKNNNKEQ